MALKDFRVLQGLAIESAAGAEIRITTYAGNPEGNITAEIGSLCADTSTGKLYKKSSGSSNTGWDEIVAGNSSSWKEPVILATTVELIVTASGTGVGKTLTADVDGKLTLDGIDAVAGQRVLVKNQGTVGDAHDNGIYTVTATGDIDDPFVLTRATDADANSEIGNGMACLIAKGNTLAGQIFYVSSSNPIDIDVDPIVFASIRVVYTASNGVKLTGTGSTNIEADLSATGGLEQKSGDSNRTGINVDDTNKTTEINSSNEIQVVGFAHKSSTGTGSSIAMDSIAVASASDVTWNIVVKNSTSGKYSCVVHAAYLSTDADFDISSIIKMGTVTKPVIDVAINTGNMELMVNAVNGYLVEITRFTNV